MTDPFRPDPDALLATTPGGGAPRRGRLRIYLGMCPGVGKTYAMLEAAQARRRAGGEVVVGLVETHGRRETLELLRGLEILPRKSMPHRGVVLEEFDLDAALARRPQLLLVDELAHTNAPGSRHERRWQDVAELLDAGLDVVTTLNVQHVESRAGTVAEITGTVVRETVPDSVFDEAEIELVDLPPADLRRRLDEGKVYLGPAAAVASAHFFREANLVVLREMALRLAAEHAGHDTRQFHLAARGEGPWKSGHRLLVAISASPHSAELIRWTRRFADSLACPWLAVHIETDRPISPAAQERLTSHLRLARELGAEVMVTSDPRFAPGLLRAAHRANATHLILGKPGGSLLARWLGEWNLLRLVRQSGGIDVHVVRVLNRPEAGAPDAAPDLEGDAAGGPPAIRGREYGLATGAVTATAGLCALLAPYLGARALAFVFLLPVIALALILGRGPVFFAAALSALAWNYFFLPPPRTLRIGAVDDMVLFAGYFIVAAILGHLIQRIQRQELAERSRERRTRTLYELTRTLAEARSRDEILWALLAAIDGAFHAPAAVSLPGPGPDHDLLPHPDSTLNLDDRERGVATWAARHRRPAGAFTDTLPGAGAFHLPMITDRGVAGVLSLVPPGRRPFTVPQRELLDAFARHAALVLDRLSLQRDVEQGRLAAESDRLGRALLDCVSHELRTPLTVLRTAACALEAVETGPDRSRQLASEIGLATRRLARLVDHLLDMSRLESGVVQARPDWTDPRDLVDAIERQVGPDLAGHPWTVTLDPTLRWLWLDPRLTTQALANMVHNACVHTPPDTPITLVLRQENGQFVGTVADAGPGLPVESLGTVFDKFHRSTSTRSGGTGLGLAIARGFITAQGGSMSAANAPAGGAVVALRLPLRDPPPDPPDHV